MFAKIAITLSLAFAAIAIPTPGGVSQCNTGAAQCCNNVEDAHSPEAAAFLSSLVGVDVSNLTGQIAFNCNPITVIGGSLFGAQCTQQPVCCQGNQANGLVNVGCTPISL